MPLPTPTSLYLNALSSSGACSVCMAELNSPFQFLANGIWLILFFLPDSVIQESNLLTFVLSLDVSLRPSLQGILQGPGTQLVSALPLSYTSSPILRNFLKAFRMCSHNTETARAHVSQALPPSLPHAPFLHPCSLG